MITQVFLKILDLMLPTMLLEYGFSSLSPKSDAQFSILKKAQDFISEGLRGISD